MKEKRERERERGGWGEEGEIEEREGARDKLNKQKNVRVYVGRRT